LEHQKERNSLWPAVGDHAGYGSGQRGKNYQNVNSLRSRKSKGGKEFVVKIFVGVEYECPRGHRFMASAPDKVLKATGSGIVKDSGNKVTSSTIDMPLYFACPCRFISPRFYLFHRENLARIELSMFLSYRQTKQLIAQLMRIHVVTPKAPVHVTLNPRVQPGPSPCPIFVTGCEEPIKLSQSAYWVLRLPYPFSILMIKFICSSICLIFFFYRLTYIFLNKSLSYVYMSEKGPYLPPKEPVSSSHGRLLAGMYGISEVVPEKK